MWTPLWNSDAGGRGRKGARKLIIHITDGIANRYADAPLIGSGGDTYYAIRIKDAANPLATANEYPLNLATAGTDNAEGDIAGQLYKIVDSVIQTEIVLSYAVRGVEILPPRTLPPKALVLALTPLLDARSAAALLDLRARGFDLVVIELSPLPFVDPGRSDAAQLAFRLWRLSRDSLRARYERAGVPVIEWQDGVTLDAALEEVTAFRRHARLAHA